MVTKWKNTIKSIFRFVKAKRKLIKSILFLLFGSAFLYNLVFYRNWHPTEEALFFGVVGISLFGTGLHGALREYLQNKYRNWLPEGEDFYEVWKEKGREQQKSLSVISLILFLLSLWYFSYQMHSYNGVWYANYASGYLMVIFVFVNYIIAQRVITGFMKEKLDSYILSMAKMNKRRLDEALEMERRSREQVSRSDQLKVDLITNVSHDLKTPLTSMVGYIELMKKEELNDTVRDYVEVISDKAARLKEMVESLFTLAKVSSGNVELKKEQIELNRLMEQVFADMADNMEESGLHFVKQLTKEDTIIIADNLYLYRICQNLMENALKYSAAGTRVFVKTYIEEKETGEKTLNLEFTNTAGYQMDFEKEDIMERFARGDKARTSDGNGLGLAIVSAYASALGGEFDIRIDCDQFKAILTFPVHKLISN